jgi:hypothetical protein
MLGVLEHVDLSSFVVVALLITVCNTNYEVIHLGDGYEFIRTDD